MNLGLRVSPAMIANLQSRPSPFMWVPEAEPPEPVERASLTTDGGEVLTTDDGTELTT